MQSEKVATRTIEAHRGDDDTVYVKVLPGAEMTLEDAEASNKVLWDAFLREGEKLYLICDYTQIKSQTRECRAYYAGPTTAANTAACAIIAGNSFGRVIGNFFMGLNKPLTPTKLFGDEAQARQWIAEQRSE